MSAYGSDGYPPEPCDRRALDDLLFGKLLCGCGDPSAGCGTVLRLLRMHPLIDHNEEMRAMLPDVGLRMLVLGLLDHAGLTEHGSNIEFSWLTGKGAGVRDALAAQEADGFEGLLDDATGEAA